LAEVHLLERVKAHLNEHFVDVDKISDQPAKRYFGNGVPGAPTSKMTVGEYFDQRQPKLGGAWTFRAGTDAKGRATGKDGTYRRGGDDGVGIGLRTHETMHRVQPRGRAAEDLDDGAARLLNLDTTGKTASGALSDYFNGGCDPELLNKPKPKKKK
jgi:hypothetical protein